MYRKRKKKLKTFHRIFRTLNRHYNCIIFQIFYYLSNSKKKIKIHTLRFINLSYCILIIAIMMRFDKENDCLQSYTFTLITYVCNDVILCAEIFANEIFFYQTDPRPMTFQHFHRFRHLKIGSVRRLNNGFTT